MTRQGYLSVDEGLAELGTHLLFRYLSPLLVIHYPLVRFLKVGVLTSNVKDIKTKLRSWQFFDIEVKETLASRTLKYQKRRELCL
jgi:hypothetical protein